MSEPRDPVTILNVDDDDANRYAVSRVLTRAGFRVVEAATGKEALEKAREQPALVVLDVELPDIHGFEVCRRLKADPLTRGAVVLHLSAERVNAESRALGLEGGADGYLVRPVQADELVATVRALLRLREAERAERRAAQEWAATFDAIADGLALVSPEGFITRINASLPAVLGKPADALLLKSEEVLVQGVAAPPRLGELRASGGRGVLELEVKGRWLRITTDALPGSQGNGAVVIVSDITGRRRAEDERARLLAREQAAREAAEAAELRATFLAEASSTLDTTLDGQTLIEHMVRLAVPRLADYAMLEAPGDEGFVRYVEALRTDEGHPATLRRGSPRTASRTVGPLAHVLRTGRAELVSGGSELLEGFTADGEQRLLMSAMHPSATMLLPLSARGHTIGALVLAATGGRRFSRDELALAEEFARRAALALDNARLYEELRDADRRKDEFLAMLAHELRNPLSAISTATHLLGREDATADQGARLRTMVKRQVRHLARMVDDLLDVSRITRGKTQLQKEPVDLVSTVQHALQALAPMVEKRGHALTLDLPGEPLPMYADAARLEQVVVNLVDNAAKYTERGGRITVTLARDPSSLSPAALLSVKDTGIGITPEQLPKIFELFAQVDQSLARSRGGLGVGLTLVRGLVELHGGTISADSAGLGKGSQFTVRLPLSQAAREAPRPVSAPAPAAEVALRVAIVEDNADARETLQNLVELWGHDVQVAGDGPTGVALLERWRPDLALVDIGLPGLDGYAVAAEARKAGVHSHLVALTGYGRPEDRERALAAGFDVHLVKPVDADALQKIIDALVARRAEPRNAG